MVSSKIDIISMNKQPPHDPNRLPDYSALQIDTQPLYLVPGSKLGGMALDAVDPRQLPAVDAWPGQPLWQEPAEHEPSGHGAPDYPSQQDTTYAQAPEPVRPKRYQPRHQPGKHSQAGARRTPMAADPYLRSAQTQLQRPVQ